MPKLTETLSLLGATTDAEASEVVQGLLSFKRGARKALRETDFTTVKELAEAYAELNSKKRESDRSARRDAKKVSKLLDSLDVDSLDDAVEALDKLHESAAEAGKLATEISKLEKKASDSEFQAVFNRLQAEGRLVESHHDWAKTQTAAQLEAWGKGAPVVREGGRIHRSDDDDVDDGKMTRVEAEVAEALGMSDKQYLNARGKTKKQKKKKGYHGFTACR